MDFRAVLKETRRAIFGLQLRTTLLLSVVVLAATGLTGGLYLRIASQLTNGESRRHARQLAKAIAVAAATDVEKGERGALLNIAQTMVPEGELAYVMFADMSGHLLAGYQKGAGSVAGLLRDDANQVSVEPLDQPELLTDGTAGPRVDVVYPITSDYSSSAKQAATGVSQPRSTVGYVRLGLSMNGPSKLLSIVANRVVALAIGITLLMVPLGFEVVRYLIAPVNQLSDAARTLAGGDLSIRVPEGRRDEIGNLSRAFNDMATDLSRSHNQLLKLNAEFEDRVLQRTEAMETANRQLQAEIEEKEDFVRAISHDLSAPLRNVSGMASVLRRKQGESLTPDAARCLERIEYNIRQELDLIDDLLELSQIHTGGGQPSTIDLRNEIESVVRQLDYDLAQKDIEVVVDGELPILYSERRRIRQLLQNLIDNATKYTDPSNQPGDRRPQIRISAEEVPGFYRFRMADNGIGVAAEDAERIFHVFRRSANRFVSDVRGKGVGLSCCKGIVQRLGGQIWVEPNPEGGSVFFFTLARSCVSPPAGIEGRADTEPIDEPTLVSNVSHEV